MSFIRIAAFVLRARSVLLIVAEFAILMTLATWTVVGLIHHGHVTGWTMSGLFTMLHEQWRGAIILGILLFYRTLREALDRVKWTKFKFPFGEFEVEPGSPLTPGQESQK